MPNSSKTSNDIVLYLNKPYPLYKENSFFVVKKGKVDIFCVKNDGKRYFVTSFCEGELFFSLKIFHNNNCRLEAFAETLEPVISKIEALSVDNQTLKNSLEHYREYIPFDENFIDLDLNNSFTVLERLFKNFFENFKNIMDKKEREELERLEKKLQEKNGIFLKSVSKLSYILGEQSIQNSTDDILIDTIDLICKNLEIEIDIKKVKTSDTKETSFETIADDLNIRYRLVELKKGWFKKDAGTFLCFTKENIPVALFPTGKDRYNLINLKTNQKTTVNKEIADTLSKKAYLIYKTLPARKLNFKDILKLSFFGNRQEFLYILFLSMFAGLMALVPPLSMGELFDNIIPQSQKGKVLQIALALVVAATSTAVFNFVSGISIARIRARISNTLQTAIFDRLIHLPPSFFRKYSIGDLAKRAVGIEQIEDILDSSILLALLNSIFSIFSVFLLFKYSVTLALIGLLLIFIMIGFNYFISMKQMKYLKEILAKEGDTSSFFLEVLNNISKVKIANIIERVYGKWSEKFFELRDLHFKSENLQNHLNTFNSTFPLVTSIVLYSVIFYSSQSQKLSTGDFIAFTAAFSQFLFSVLRFNQIVINLLYIKPIFQRLSPILEEIPETLSSNIDPGELKGDIEIKNLSFNYTDNKEKTVLEDINIDIKEGEFIAIVGTSGSGKSTLLRLMLGFETPTEGSIFYDNQNLQDINIKSVRSQIGVVLQDGKLINADIFTNIVGSTNKTLQDAYRVAKKVGLDKDIEEMPMKMKTIISNFGSAISGGQRQKLLIARALINDPKILFLDEATSALDNDAQKVIMESLDKLKITRVVIAHRLSTIMNADKIYVLDKGKIVQKGKYDKLLEEDGIFKRLAQRQIA